MAEEVSFVETIPVEDPRLKPGPADERALRVLAAVDRDWIDSVFGELPEMRVDLSADPIAEGPSTIQGKASTLSGFLTSATNLRIEVSNILRAIKTCLLEMRAVRGARRNLILATDNNVRQEKAASDREAAVSYRLVSTDQIITQLEVAEIDLDAAARMVDLKLADLRSTHTLLKQQVTLCGQEIGLGRSWEGLPEDRRGHMREGQKVQSLEDFLCSPDVAGEAG